VRAGGNAFYLEELMRAVAAGDRDRFPETMLAMVEARLESVPAETRRVLRAGSVFGLTFRQGAVASLLGVVPSDPELRAHLDGIEREELISRAGAASDPAENEFAFRHAVVREATYRTLTRDDQRLAHRLAAEWLERAGTTDALAVAQHFELGDERSRASMWYLRAAELALGGNDLASAIELARRGLGCEPPLATTGSLRRVLGEGHYWRAEYRDAHEFATSALPLLTVGGPEWCEVSTRLAVIHTRLGDMGSVRATSERLREGVLAATGPGVVPRAIALARVAAALTLSGHADLAGDILRDAIALGGTLCETEPALVARIRDVQAMRAVITGDPGMFTTYRLASTRAYDLAGDRRNACMGRVNLAYGYMELGEFEAAESELRGAIETAERMDARGIITSALHNLGFTRFRRGDLDEALTIERAAVDRAVAQSDVRMEYASRFYLARIHWSRGEFAESLREASVVLDDARTTKPVRAAGLAIAARAMLSLGYATEALEHAERSVALIDSIGGIEDGEALARLVLAETKMACGHADEAHRAIASARDRLNTGAARLADATARDAYMQRIEEHARTMALADEWLAAGDQTT
jgi:tetratricopeptide (TPR) repeat protein